MSRRGNCWDNAVAESFFCEFEERTDQEAHLQDRELATEDVSDYINSFYNPIRRHRHLGGVSPEAFETSAKHA